MGILTGIKDTLGAFGHDIAQGAAPPQYTADPNTGAVQQIPQQTTPGSMFKNLLVGALAGLATPTPRGSDSGESFAAGMQGAQNYFQRRNQLAREQAIQNSELQQRATEQMDLHTLRQAQAAAAQQASLRDALRFNQQDPASLEQQADRWNANQAAGAKPLQMFGQAVQEFDSLSDAENFANTHPQAVIAGFHSQIVRNPNTGKWAIHELPNQEEEFDLGTKDANGNPVKARMTPIAYSNYVQGKQKFERDQKKTDAEIDQAKSATAKNYADARKANAEAAATSMVNPSGSAGLQGSAYIATLDPAHRNTVQAIVDGRMTMTPQQLRTKDGQALVAMVNRADPSYDWTKAEAYWKTRLDMTSGVTSRGILALNTALTHLDRLNSHITYGATLPGVSAVERAFGNKNATAYDTDVNAVSQEIGKAYKAGVISEQEHKDWQAMLHTWTPQNARGHVQELASLLQGQFQSLQQKWNAAKPSPSVQDLQFISPQAKVAYQRLTGQSMDGQPTHAVVVNGQIVGYTSDGKTMTPVQQ